MSSERVDGGRGKSGILLLTYIYDVSQSAKKRKNLGI